MSSGNSQQIRLGLDDAYVTLHAHIACFVEHDEDLQAALEVLSEGLRVDDHCVLVGDEAIAAEALGVLARAGLDAAALTAKGRLATIGGVESGDALLDTLSKTFSRMVESGASVIRAVVNLGWLEQGWPSVMELLALEVRINKLAERFPCVLLCLYDMRTLPGILMRYGALETHPITIRGRRVEKNPLCLATETALKQLGEMSSTLCDFERVAVERRRNDQALLALRELSTSLQSTLELDKILEDVLRTAAAVVGAESGIAAFCSPDGASGYLRLVRGEVVASELAPDGYIPGRLLFLPVPYLSNDPAHDPHIDQAQAEHFGVVSVLSTPILDGSGGMIGFLEMHNKADGSGFSAFDQGQLASAAQIAALAAKNADAFRKISQMGASLRESTERYRHLVEGLDAIVWEAEAETFKFTFVSRQAEAMLGYPVSQWLEEPDFWINHIHPEDRELAVDTCRSATRQGTDHRFVYRMLAADGRVVWLRDHARSVLSGDGKRRRLRGLMVDISASMSTQEALRKSEAKFRSVFEGAGIGMTIVDAEGRLTQTNPEFQSMLGYQDHELAEMTFFQLSHPEDRNSGVTGFAALMSRSLMRFQVEKRFLRKDGRELCGLVTFSAVQLESGTPCAIAMVEDVTERKQAEAEVSELLSQVQKDAAQLEKRVAERTEQLEEINSELDSFAHSVSHDLRAPLRAMQGFVEILIEDGTLSERDKRQYLQRILSASQGMDRLIQNLLAYSRLSRQDIALQPVSLDQVVGEAAQQLELASGGKKYELEVRGPLPEVMGHHAVLVQVLLNLMTNGIKFVPAGVRPKLRVWAESREQLCRLYVQDNGIGIPQEHQERIFKIFERLHSIDEYPGTGVGLAIVRKAVTRLGGTIGVISREGEGSRFWIEFPVAPRGTAHA